MFKYLLCIIIFFNCSNNVNSEFDSGTFDTVSTEKDSTEATNDISSENADLVQIDSLIGIWINTLSKDTYQFCDHGHFYVSPVKENSFYDVRYGEYKLVNNNELVSTKIINSYFYDDEVDLYFYKSLDYYHYERGPNVFFQNGNLYVNNSLDYDNPIPCERVTVKDGVKSKFEIFETEYDLQDYEDPRNYVGTWIFSRLSRTYDTLFLYDNGDAYWKFSYENNSEYYFGKNNCIYKGNYNLDGTFFCDFFEKISYVETPDNFDFNWIYFNRSGYSSYGWGTLDNEDWKGMIRISNHKFDTSSFSQKKNGFFERNREIDTINYNDIAGTWINEDSSVMYQFLNDSIYFSAHTNLGETGSFMRGVYTINHVEFTTVSKTVYNPEYIDREYAPFTGDLRLSASELQMFGYKDLREYYVLKRSDISLVEFHSIDTSKFY